MAHELPVLELQVEELYALVGRIEGRQLEECDYPKLKAIIETMVLQYQAAQGHDVSMKRVLRMMYGASTEKTRNLFKEEGKSKGRKKPPAAKKNGGKRKGHGRRAASAYWGGGSGANRPSRAGGWTTLSCM